MTRLDDLLYKAKCELNAAVDGYDLDAAIRRLASRSIWHELTDAVGAPAAGAAAPLPDDVQPDSIGTAAQDLEALCRRTVRSRDSGELLHGFISDYHPGGARVFACLLYLTGRSDGAVFWWHFAAGAEDVPSMRCLTLHHMVDGHTEIAWIWSERARAAGTATAPCPVPGLPGGADPSTLVAKAERKIRELHDPHLEPSPGPIYLPEPALADDLEPAR